MSRFDRGQSPACRSSAILQRERPGSPGLSRTRPKDGRDEGARQVTARAVLDRADVDTDQIIPKQFLKRIERSGYGEFLFFDWMKDPGVRAAPARVRGRADPGRRPQLRLRLLARARGLGARGLRLPRRARAELQRHLPLERGQDRAWRRSSCRRRTLDADQGRGRARGTS